MCNWVERTTNASTKHDGEVLFCCEHTGSYCLEVCDYLSENGKYIWLGNPLDIKRSMGLVRGKDDVIDSRRIATFAAEKHHKAVLYMRPEDSTRTLKYLLSIRNTLIEQKKALSCQIKENFPMRMGFRMLDKRDSIVVLDRTGAERLDGNGDMLLLRGPDVERVQGTFLSTDECRVIKVKEENNIDYDSVVTPE